MTVGEVCLIVCAVIAGIFGIIVPIYGIFVRKFTYKEIFLPIYTEYRQETFVDAKKKGWIQITFEQFLDYYALNPKNWEWKDLVYWNRVRYWTGVYWQDCYFDYPNYKKFRAWKEQIKEQKKRKEELKIEEENRQKQIVFLEAIQKDIDKVKAKAEKERNECKKTYDALLTQQARPTSSLMDRTSRENWEKCSTEFALKALEQVYELMDNERK